MCVFLCTSYEEGGPLCHLGSAEATADTLVSPGVPGLDLGDQQRAIGEQEHSVERKHFTLPALLTQAAHHPET